MPIVLIDNFDSFSYNLYQLIREISTHELLVYRNNAIEIEALLSKRPSHVILSPGPGHPAIPSDFGVCRDIITHAEKLNCPLLGVCLGHQGIAHYFGGQVIQAPSIVHGKSSFIEIQETSPLLEGISNPFQAMRYHSLIVSDDKFPEEFKILARETKEQLIMAIQHKTLPIYGVQFHPESIGTPEGKQLLRNFIEKC